jgi:hypothetical protein
MMFSPLSRVRIEAVAVVCTNTWLPHVRKGRLRGRLLLHRTFPPRLLHTKLPVPASDLDYAPRLRRGIYQTKPKSQSYHIHILVSYAEIIFLVFDDSLDVMSYT